MDYEKLNIEFTVAIVKAAIAIKAFPKPLKPYVTPANVYDRTPNPDVWIASRLFFSVTFALLPVGVPDM